MEPNLRITSRMVRLYQKKPSQFVEVFLVELVTPWKINMEPKNGGLVQMMLLFNFFFKNDF